MAADGPLASYFNATTTIGHRWKEQALCLGRPERQKAWFLQRYDQGYSKERVALALGTCEICPVQWDCVTYAIETESIYGIWAIGRDHRRALAKRGNWRELVETARVNCRPVSSVVVQIGRDPWHGIQSRPMTPTYGATLIVDEEVLADDAIIIPAGTKSITAYAYDPEKEENVVIAEMLKPSYDDNKSGSTVTGLDRQTGAAQVWVIGPGRRCRGCS